jgi:SAM-dependent methyltransferase
VNEDRITELYEGTLGTGPEYQVARQRVHWICSQCEGDDVLDVGCSQGIVSILIAREGRTVTGVDNETGAIEFARHRLQEEEETVQQRLDFVQAEASALPFDDSSFDTVIMGELLEHLIDQRPPLEEAARVLRPGGRLIVTTPYGLYPYHDHKEPLYLGRLAELLVPEFEIEEVELLDRYLGLIGRGRPGKRPRVSPRLLRRFLELAERRLATQDQRAQHVQRLEGERDRLSRELERKGEKLKELWGERSRLKSELREAKQGARKAERLEHQVLGLSRQAQALAAIRGSRSYRLMGAVWRVNDALHWRPGRRRRNRTAGVIVEPGDKEAEPRTARARYEALDIDADRRAFLAADRRSAEEERGGRPSALRIAAIADPWLEMALGATCPLITFRPDNWPYLLEARPPDLLLVQSAWRGNSGSWEYRVPSYTHPDAGGLGELIDWCRARDVPTVFWHTEGAEGVPAFSRAASLCDLVAAASSGVADRLQHELGDERSVLVLPLAAQPLVHRPRTDLGRQSALAFVGDCSPEARHDGADALLDAAADSPSPSLEIFHTGRDHVATVPERLEPHLRPYTPPAKLVEVFQSRVAVLAGAPRGPAFIPAHVFEALSCGAAVISAPNPEVPSLLGEVVPVASTAKEAASRLERLLGDDEHRLAVLREARRLILSAHTYQHRLSEIARAAGREDAVWSPPTVAVLAVLESRQELDSFLGRLAEQSRRPDELVIAFENGDSLDGLPGALDDIKVSFEALGEGNGTLSAETSRRLCQRASSQWISWFDRKRRYQPDHLATLLESTYYTDAVVAVARSRYSIAGDGRAEGSTPGRVQPDPGSLLIRADEGRARGVPLPGDDGLNALGSWARDEAALVPSGEHELLTARNDPQA